MKIMNPEGSLLIDTGVDRDGEIEMVIENPKPDTAQSVYIGRSVASGIIKHLSDVFVIGTAEDPIKAELVEALNNLCWECDAITETRAPSRKAYNEAQAVLAKHKGE